MTLPNFEKSRRRLFACASHLKFPDRHQKTETNCEGDDVEHNNTSFRLHSFSITRREDEQRIRILPLRKYQPNTDSSVGRHLVILSGFVLQAGSLRNSREPLRPQTSIAPSRFIITPLNSKGEAIRDARAKSFIGN
jgi:hypothetical protein